jgi:hypothetical protein
MGKMSLLGWAAAFVLGLIAGFAVFGIVEFVVHHI